MVALFIIMSGTAVAAPLSFNAVGALPAPVSINITSPADGEYVQHDYAVISWTLDDAELATTHFLVYADSDAPISTTSWEVNLTGLADGPHWVVVRAFNSSQPLAEDTVFFFVSATPPSLSIVSPSNGDMLNYSDVTVTWNSADDIGISYFEAKVDDNPWITPIDLNANSNTFSDLPDGHHTVTVLAHSWGGHTATATVGFTIDTTYPEVTITQPDNGQGFGHSNVTVTWEGVDAGGNIMGYQIWVDGAYTTFAAPSEDSFSLNYADGHHTVRIVVVDTANSTAADEVSFYVDTIAPEITAASPEGGKVMVETNIVVIFSKPMDPEHTDITVSGVSGTVQWNGTTLSFTPSGDLENGKTYTVMVVGKDMLGNNVTKTWTFTTVSKDNPLAIYGVLAAVIGVVIVGILFYMSRMKKEEPPSRSWRGTEELKKRSARSKKWDDDEDDEDEE